MAKEPEPKSTGEDQNQVVGLSAYVSKRLNDISIQKVEAEAQAFAAKDRGMKLFLQRTAFLRRYLLELADPMDELLSRFRVRELLEEAQSKFCPDGSIKRLEPPIYRAVVSQPDPQETLSVLFDFSKKTSHALFNFPQYGPSGEPNFERINGDLNRLLEADNFQEIQLARDMKSEDYKYHPWRGYGLALERKFRIRAPKVEWGITSHGSSTWHGPGAGDITTPSRYGWVETRGTVDAVESRSITIEVIKSESTAYPYDLSYTYYVDQYDPFPERKIGDRRVKARESREYLTPPVRIYASQSPEVLIQRIGDDVIDLKSC